MHAKLLKKCKAQKDDKLFFLAACAVLHLMLSLGKVVLVDWSICCLQPLIMFSICAIRYFNPGLYP